MPRGKERADMMIILMCFYCNLLDIKMYFCTWPVPNLKAKAKQKSAKHSANVLHGGGV